MRSFFLGLLFRRTQDAVVTERKQQTIFAAGRVQFCTVPD